MKNLFLALALTLFAVMTACTSKKQQDTGADTDATKALVLYYSQTGATKAVAEQLSNLLGADIEAIEVETPYDGTYQETIQRCMDERQNNTKPKINPLKADLSQYDTVYLGYPIWFGTYAPPIAGLIEVCDFDGKKIVPFCTFGSGGLEQSTADLKEALPKAQILEGYGVRNARIAAMPEELNYFLISNEYMPGEVEALPEYSEQKPVTDEESAIFHEACDNYQFPLGTPVTVASRTTDKGMDYKYIVNSKDMQGQDVESVIYVIKPNEGNAEFTRVVR